MRSNPKTFPAWPLNHKYFLKYILWWKKQTKTKLPLNMDKTWQQHKKRGIKLWTWGLGGGDCFGFFFLVQGFEHAQPRARPSLGSSIFTKKYFREGSCNTCPGCSVCTQFYTRMPKQKRETRSSESHTQVFFFLQSAGGPEMDWNTWRQWLSVGQLTTHALTLFLSDYASYWTYCKHSSVNKQGLIVDDAQPDALW